MATTKHQATLTVAAEVVGGDKLRSLSKDVKELASSGGEATPEFKKLATELDKLADQADLISEFETVSAKLTKTRSAFNDAFTESNKLRKEFDAQRQSVSELGAQQLALTQKLRDARTAQAEAINQFKVAKEQYAQLSNEIGSTRKATQDQKDALKAASQAMVEAKDKATTYRNEIIELRKAKDANTVALENERKSMREANAEWQKANETTAKLSKDVRSSVESLNSQSQALSKLGIDSKNLSSSQAAIASSTTTITTKIAELNARLADNARMAKLAGDDLRNAFSVVGVRSARQINDEIKNIDQALLKLASDTRVNGAEFDRAFAAGQAKISELKKELSTVGDHSDTLNGKFDRVSSSLRNVATAMAAAFGVQKILQANAAMDSAERTLRVVSGSAEAAAREMDFVRKVAAQSGVDLISAADAYASLAAAAKGTKLEGEGVKGVFEAVSRSMGVLGKSAYETDYALRAIQQMISKGTVSMEEFRQQLSERMPGAFQKTAEGLGITTEELTKLITNGKLTAEEVLPALEKGLKSLYGAEGNVESINASFARLKNTLTELMDRLVSNDGLVWVTDRTTRTIQLMASAVGIDLAGSAAKAENSIAAVSVVSNQLGITADEAAAKLGNFAATGKKAADTSQELADKTAVAKQVAGFLGISVEEASKKLTEYEESQRRAKEATEQQSAELVRQKVAFADAQTQTEADTIAADKNAAAKKAATTAVEQYASAFETEKVKRDLAIQSAQQEAVAYGQLAEARKAELASWQVELDAKLELAKGREIEGTAIQKEIQALQTKISAMQAEYEKSVQQQNQMEVNVGKLQAEAAAYADNASKVDVLKKAYDESIVVLERLKAARQGLTDESAKALGIDERIKEAQIESGKAAVLYRDALNDQTLAIQRNNQINSEKLNLNMTQLELAKQTAQREYDVAMAYGNTAYAQYQKNKISEIEIQMAELTAKMKYAEAEAQLKAAEAKLREAEASGKNIEAARAEIEAAKVKAEILRLQGKISEETAQRIRDLARASYQLGSAQSGAKPEVDAMTASLEKQAAAAEKAKSAKDSFGNREGSYTVSSSWESMLAKLGYTNLSNDQISGFKERIQYEYDVSRAKSVEYNKGIKIIDPFKLENDILESAVKSALDYVNRDLQKKDSSSSGANIPSTTTLSNIGNTPPSSSHTVNINIGGKTTTISTASQTDSTALISLLNQLETQMRVAA